MDDYLKQAREDLIEFVGNKYDFEDGAVQTEISSLDFYYSTSTTEFNCVLYEPSLCVILQGSKAVGFGEKLYEYNPSEYLLSSTHIPANVRILEASQEVPYLSFRIKFSLEDIYEVLKNTNPSKLQYQQSSEKGLFFDDLDYSLYEPMTRLIKLLEKPKEDIEYLSPMIIKEILYKLVNDKSGYFLNKFVTEGTTSNKVVKVISEIKNKFNEKLNIKELAEFVQMSESSLYQNFKVITSMTPIQFQKNLRLQEAKQILTVKNIEINEVAFAVGYESPSQFSREYSRMFGLSPKAHSDILKNQVSA